MKNGIKSAILFILCVLLLSHEVSAKKPFPRKESKKVLARLEIYLHNKQYERGINLVDSIRKLDSETYPRGFTSKFETLEGKINRYKAIFDSNTTYLTQSIKDYKQKEYFEANKAFIDKKYYRSDDYTYTKSELKDKEYSVFNAYQRDIDSANYYKPLIKDAYYNCIHTRLYVYEVIIENNSTKPINKLKRLNTLPDTTIAVGCLHTIDKERFEKVKKEAIKKKFAFNNEIVNHYYTLLNSPTNGGIAAVFVDTKYGPTPLYLVEKTNYKYFSSEDSAKFSVLIENLKKYIQTRNSSVLKKNTQALSLNKKDEKAIIAILKITPYEFLMSVEDKNLLRSYLPACITWIKKQNKKLLVTLEKHLNENNLYLFFQLSDATLQQEQYFEIEDYEKFLILINKAMEKKGIKKGNSYSNNSVTWSGTEILNYFFSGNTTYESSKKVYHDTKTLYNIGKIVLYDVPKSIISPIYKLWRRFR